MLCLALSLGCQQLCYNISIYSTFLENLTWYPAVQCRSFDSSKRKPPMYLK